MKKALTQQKTYFLTDKTVNKFPPNFRYSTNPKYIEVQNCKFKFKNNNQYQNQGGFPNEPIIMHADFIQSKGTVRADDLLQNATIVCNHNRRKFLVVPYRGCADEFKLSFSNTAVFQDDWVDVANLPDAEIYEYETYDEDPSNQFPIRNDPIYKIFMRSYLYTVISRHEKTYASSDGIIADQPAYTNHRTRILNMKSPNFANQEERIQWTNRFNQIFPENKPDRYIDKLDIDIFYYLFDTIFQNDEFNLKMNPLINNNVTFDLYSFYMLPNKTTEPVTNFPYILTWYYYGYTYTDYYVEDGTSKRLIYNTVDYCKLLYSQNDVNWNLEYYGLKYGIYYRNKNNAEINIRKAMENFCTHHGFPYEEVAGLFSYICSLKPTEKVEKNDILNVLQQGIPVISDTYSEVYTNYLQLSNINENINTNEKIAAYFLTCCCGPLNNGPVNFEEIEYDKPIIDDDFITYKMKYVYIDPLTKIKMYIPRVIQYEKIKDDEFYMFAEFMLIY